MFIVREFRECTWIMRCKLAAELSRAASWIGNRAWRRLAAGRPAWFSLPATATLIAAAKLVLPQHLRDSVEDCTTKAFER